MYHPTRINYSRAAKVRMHLVLTEMLPPTQPNDAIVYTNDFQFCEQAKPGFHLCRSVSYTMFGRMNWFYSAPTDEEEDALEAICDMVFIYPLDARRGTYDEVMTDRASLISLYESLA